MRCAIGVGSNLGDRLAYLQAAMHHLSLLQPAGSPPPRCSSIYETSPVDCPPGSSSFLNMVALADFDCSTPQDLLGHLQAIEKTCGRIRPSVPNAPRTLDLDLLLLEEQTIQTSDLIVPHPRLAVRAFVLKPLAEVAPAWRVPPDLKTIAELVAGLSATDLEDVCLVAPPLTPRC